MPRIRVGVIGANWGRMHVGAFRGADAEVVALCGRDARRTAEIAASEQIPLSTTDVRALCDACEVVVVASPDAAHHAHVKLALEAGRHVLCEKPLAFTFAEALELSSLAAARPRLVCAVSFPYRMLPPMAALRTWLSTRRPRSLEVTVRNSFAAAEGREASGDLGGLSHLIDNTLSLMPAVDWVDATLIGAPPHSATLILGLEGGGSATISQLASSEPGIFGRWSIVGDGWDAEVAGGYLPALGGWRIGPARVHEGSWAELSPLLEPRPNQREPWAQAHVETARAFLGAIAGESRGALATFADGARVQQVLDAAVRSNLEGRRIAVG